MKKTLGFEYETGSFMLSRIDKFADLCSETSPGITKEFANKWREKRANESEMTRYERIRCLAEFSSYLRDLGLQSYIPKLIPFPNRTFVPYIYSKSEIDAIFKACDELTFDRPYFNSHLLSIPAIIRLLYSTGIRIGEALALKNDDVNLEDKYLCITDLKNSKRRIIPISDSLTSVCKEYVKYRGQLPLGNKKSEYFFIKLNGQKCGPGVQLWFRKCLEKAGIPYIGRKKGPRIHDLRHTFAVTSLANMADSGIDMYAALPILSNYLGHQSINSTNHYVRLTANMYPDLIKNVDMVCLDIFPKFKNYENN